MLGYLAAGQVQGSVLVLVQQRQVSLGPVQEDGCTTRGESLCCHHRHPDPIGCASMTVCNLVPQLEFSSNPVPGDPTLRRPEVQTRLCFGAADSVAAVIVRRQKPSPPRSKHKALFSVEVNWSRDSRTSRLPSCKRKKKNASMTLLQCGSIWTRLRNHLMRASKPYLRRFFQGEATKQIQACHQHQTNS